MGRALNIGFVSTRFSGSDGVSLETAKWAKVFQEFGHVVHWFGGVLDTPAERSYVHEPAFFNTEKNIDLNRQVFGVIKRSRELTDLIQHEKETLKDALYEYINRFSINLIVAENCLAIPMQIPLALALSEVIAETGLPTIGHHHDFYWERQRFLVNAIGDYIPAAFPPDLPSIRHVVINSLIQKDLAAKRGISSTVIFNVEDFDQTRDLVDEYNSDFRESLGFADTDILILQPTRVVARKGIEHALQLVSRLELPHVKLIVSHSVDDEGLDYIEWIQESANQLKVSLHLLNNRLQLKRAISADGQKQYSLWDVYPHADLITYPSLYEGFGNAFLEAVLYRKPILVNRYSVYVTDIEPKGFQVIAMDGYLSQRTVARVRDILLDRDKQREMADVNYQIARRHFSLTVLKRRLGMVLSSFYGDLDG